MPNYRFLRYRLQLAKRLIFAVLPVLVSTDVLAQPTTAWTAYANGRLDDNASANCVDLPGKSQAMDSSGNVFVTGCAFNTLNYDMLTYKLDGNTGAVLWTRSFVGSGNGQDRNAAIAVDASGNVVVTGFSTDSGQGENIRTIKYHGATGMELWNVAFNGSGNGADRGYDVSVDASGNVVVTGSSTDIGQGTNTRTIKYNGSNGAQLWSAAYNGGGTGSDIARAVVIDAVGNVLVTGGATIGGQASNMLTIKYDGATGAELWNADFDAGNSVDQSYALALDAVGDVVITGTSHPGTGGNQTRTIKYNGASGAQLWTVAYTASFGDSSSRDIAVDASGAVLVITSSGETGGGQRIRTIKYSGATGESLWNTAYPVSSTGHALALDQSGDVIVTGYSSEIGQQFRTVKYNGISGAQLWHVAYSGGQGASIGVNAANDVVVTGYSVNSGGGQDIRTIKYTGITGAQIWTAKEDALLSIAGVGNNAAKAMAVDASGHVVVTGSSLDTAQRQNIRTIKYDAVSGAELWNVSYNGSSNNNDQGNALVIDAAGDVYVTGFSTDLNQGTNVRTIKYTGATGAQLWSVAYNSISNNGDVGTGIALDAGGYVLVTGSSIETGKNADIRTIKYDASTGAELWGVKFNGSNNGSDVGRSIAVDSSGNVLVAGTSTDKVGDQNIRVIKYNATTGDELWNVFYNGSSNASDAANALILDASGNPIVVGTSTDISGAQNVRTIKYDGSTGLEIWSMGKDGALNAYDEGAAITLDVMGEVLVTGLSSDTTQGLSMRTTKYSGATGAELWSTAYGGAGNEFAYAVAVDASGDVIVNGTSNGANQSSKRMRTIKYQGATGTTLWNRTFNTIGNAEGYAVAAHDSGAVYVLGTVILPGMPQALVVQKLQQQQAFADGFED